MRVYIEAEMPGFEVLEDDFLVAPENDMELPAFRLTSTDVSEDDPDPEAPDDPEESGEAAYITLESLSHESIQVRETGGTESAEFVFMVTDSAGVPVGNHNAVDVRFDIVSGPDGGESIHPASVPSQDGVARASLTSGKASGVVQVQAEFTNAKGIDVRSNPVSLVIHAGLPSQDHFTLYPDKRNVSLSAGESNMFTVLAGDKYGNEVPDGTAIYFTTDGGFIQGSAYTSNGRASAPLTVGNPVPPDGVTTVTASTVDDNQQPVTASSQVIFSGDPIITVTPETFDIPNAEDQMFTYTVRDENGNPMEDGTSITVTVEGDEMSVLGDVAVTVGEANANFTNLSELTDYTFIIDDAEPDVTNDTPVQITIEVDGPNGNARKTLTGRKAKIRP